MARAQTVGLQHGLNAWVICFGRRRDSIGAIAHNDNLAVQVQPPRGIQSMQKQRPTRDRVQNLRQVRLHAFALARCQKNQLCCHVCSFLC